MGALALILGLLGAICGILGIVTVIGVFPLVHPALTWEVWFWIAALLLLGTIASAVGRGGEYE